MSARSFLRWAFVGPYYPLSSLRSEIRPMIFGTAIGCVLAALFWYLEYGL